MSFIEWIILRRGGQTWYNYFIPPPAHHEISRAKFGKGGINENARYTNGFITSRINMRGSRKFCQRGSKTFFFWSLFFLDVLFVVVVALFMRGERIQYLYKRVIIGPPAKRRLDGITLACQ